MPLMKKKGTCILMVLISLKRECIRKDITVIMCAPKCPGSEVREEYKRGFEYQHYLGAS
jgi:ketol-acid reductoisomerase